MVLALETTGCVDVVTFGSQTIVVASNLHGMDTDAENGPRPQVFQEWAWKMVHFAEIQMEWVKKLGVSLRKGME